jgi:hypothetical protein
MASAEATPPAAINATSTGVTPATPATTLPGQLPDTGGNTDFGTGWLAVGLVVLLMAAGVAALFKEASGQGLR